MKITAHIRQPAALPRPEPEKASGAPEDELTKLRQEVTSLCKKYYDTLRSHFAERLFSRDYLHEDLFLKELEELGIHFEGTDFMLMESEIEDQQHLFFEQFDPDQRQQFDQACFAVENIMEELVRPFSACEVFHLHNGSYCVLCSKSTTEQPAEAPALSRIERLNALANNIVRVVQEKLGIHISIVISRPFSSLSGVALCAQDVQNIREFRSLYHLTAPVMCYRDFEAMETESPASDRNFRLEKQYLYCIEHGDYEQARLLMHQMLEAEFIQSTPRPNLGRVKLISKLDLLAETMNSADTDARRRISDHIDRLLLQIGSKELSFPQFRARMDEIFDEILSSHTECPAPDAPAWVPQLMRYVQEHYTTPDLNVTQLAQWLDRSPSYVTRTVRKYTGCSLFDTIQQLRLKHAIAVLRSGASLHAAAAGSGFGDIRSMRRAFKKYLDTTPSSFLETP